MTSTDRTPSSSNFERALGEELIAMATERAAGSTAAVPAPRRSAVRRRPLLAALAVGAAAVTTAVVLPAVLGGEHGGNAAYAVTEESDGTIKLQLRDPAGLDGMVAELRRHGVRAAGLEEAGRPGECPLPFPEHPAEVPVHGFGDTPGTVRIDPRAVPAGQTLLLTTAHVEGRGGDQVAFSAWLVDEVPACVPTSVVVVPAGSPFPTGLPSGFPTGLPSGVPTASVPSGGVTPAPTPVPSGTGTPVPSGAPGGWTAVLVGPSRS